MALGLGQMLGGMMLGQMTGLLGDNKPKDQQTTQVANNTTQQGFGGFGGILNNVSNQMFQGMSQEQVARLGQGFNSMTLRPDKGLHAAFQGTIDNASVTKGRNSAIAVLRKQGKNAIADMLQTGGIDVKTAMQYAIEDDGNGDAKAMLKILRADPKNLEAMDLADILEADPSMNTEVWKSYMALTGLDGENETSEYALGVSEIMTHQGEDENEGRHYMIQTNKATGDTKKVWLDSYGETLKQKDFREQEVKKLVKDEEKATLMGNDAYDRSRDLRNQVQQFEQALSLVEDGALSGWLNQKLPAINDRTALLRGIQNDLGISVINSATFGALSEREMQMAMATNLDLNLPPKELREMIIEQIRVRTKLAQEFESRARSILVDGDGKWSSYVKYELAETKKHDAVVWEKLKPSEIEDLLKVGITRDKYMDKDYTWRRKFFDGRAK